MLHPFFRFGGLIRIRGKIWSYNGETQSVKNEREDRVRYRCLAGFQTSEYWFVWIGASIYLMTKQIPHNCKLFAKDI